MEESKKYFEQALERCKQEAEHEPQYYNAISVTTNYNLGRIFESLFMTDKAEKIYKETLKGNSYKFQSPPPPPPKFIYIFYLKKIIAVE